MPIPNESQAPYRVVRRFQRSPDKQRLTTEQGRAQRRVGELAKIYKDQCPHGLPHNALGVKYARYMCRTLAFLPRDDRAKWLNRNADWIDRDTRDNILSLGPYWYAPRSLGDHLELYDEDRERLGIRTIEACDVTIEQRTEINEVKKHRRQEKWRRKSGAKPREQYLSESLSRTKPWKAEKISRRTWERRRKAAAVASPRRSSISYTTCLGLASPSAADDGSVLRFIETASAVLGNGVDASADTSPTTAQSRNRSFKEAA
jgi:hypothetical protein